VLPDWVDLHFVQLFVASTAVLALVGAVLLAALTRQLWLRAGASLLLVGAAVALCFYYAGPLQDAERDCHYHLLKSDVPVDGCLVPNDGTGAATAAH
jgi:hypothetical protein